MQLQASRKAGPKPSRKDKAVLTFIGGRVEGNVVCSSAGRKMLTWLLLVQLKIVPEQLTFQFKRQLNAWDLFDSF
ncbi:MAG: hypothetical protein ACJATN_001531 [Neolewinella sp.]|jgi:hypothetical protein